jgi:hypothetical protein
VLSGAREPPRERRAERPGADDDHVHRADDSGGDFPC